MTLGSIGIDAPASPKNKALTDSILEETMSEKTLNLIKDSEARWVDLGLQIPKAKNIMSLSRLGKWAMTFLSKARCLMVHQSKVGRALMSPT